MLVFGIFLISLTTSFGQTTDTSTTKTSGNKISQVDSATVYVSFIVEITGKITNVKIDKIKCKKCSKKFKESLKSEAIRVVESMPDWKTSKERIKFLLPIKFKLTDE